MKPSPPHLDTHFLLTVTEETWLSTATLHEFNARAREVMIQDTFQRGSPLHQPPRGVAKAKNSASRWVLSIFFKNLYSLCSSELRTNWC